TSGGVGAPGALTRRRQALREKNMIWTLLSSAIIALFMAGMILAAKVPPHADAAEGENRAASRRLEFIRRSSVCR
ncbi:MAG: hypothetical protein NTW80_13490, partial [Deltaproteobacteria bacterium]|nr:hypothetical protein [Deltaproteobacteria bacterium]